MQTIYILLTMFNLSEYLSNQRRLVDEALGRALPAESVRPQLLHCAMRYSIFSGGKRLRPILALAAADAVGCAADVMTVACAVEVLHTYTLVHDDLPCMDDDDLRRGQPTCHKKFGEANAVLAGDALQALAFELAAGSAVNPAEVVLELASAAGSLGVVGGQVADIAAEDSLSEDDVLFIHQHKTADLFRAAIRMGAIASGATEPELAALTVYGSKIGLAFQIIDDILDDADPDDESCSCIGLYGMDRARGLAAELTADAVAALEDLPGNTDALVAIANYMLERTF
jgi:geranylgeranyl diphosphate synthase type II